jgi:hypothetical protein
MSLYEQTRDFQETASSSSLVLHEGNLLAGQEFECSFTLPIEAPPSFKGKHSELWWEVETRSNEPGFDTIARRRIEVVAAPT